MSNLGGKINNHDFNVKHFLQYALGFITVTVFCLVLGFVLNPPKAKAAIGLNPLLGFTMPTANFNYLNNCDGQPNSPAFTTWLSSANNPTVTSITVPYGTTSIPLWYNWNGATCHSSGGSVIQVKQHLLGSPTPGVSGLPPAALLHFGGGNPVGFYTKTQAGFNFAPPGGFTTTRDYTIQINTRSINHFPGAPNFRCVPGPNATNSIDNHPPCPITTPSFIIHVVVQRPPIGAIDITCGQIRGWALDLDRPGRSIGVHIYRDGPAGGGGVGLPPIIANGSRPDVNAAYGVTGNHGFNLSPLPSSLSDGLPHKVWVYGIGVNSAGNEDGIQGLLDGSGVKVVTIPPCGPTPPTGFTVSALGDVDPLPDSESPLSVRFRLNASTNKAPLNNIDFKETYYIKRHAGGTRVPLGDSGTTLNNINFPSTSLLGLPMQTVSLAGQTFTAGDKVCMDVVFSPAAGLSNSSGTVTSVTTPSASIVDICATIKNKPYVRTFGGDSFAGSTCTSGWPASDEDAGGNIDAGGIYGNGTDINGPAGRGSASQLALLSLYQIRNFRNSVFRPGATYDSLNFANSNLPSFSVASGPKGGYLGVTHCPTNYVAAMPVANLAPNLAANGTYKHTGDYELPATTGFNNRVLIYVVGNVKITGDFTYNEPATGWANRNAIPALTIVATGNISIDPSVTRIDGVLIAQNTDVSLGGTIYTCGNMTTYKGILASATGYYDTCNNQLTVNGALIAARVKFGRTFGSQRDSDGAGDYPGGSSSSCSNQGGVSSGGTCAAEVINFRPETYLALPPSNSSSGTKFNFDSIVSPPPLL